MTNTPSMPSLKAFNTNTDSTLPEHMTLTIRMFVGYWNLLMPARSAAA